jgi:hypothetical protein
MWYDVAVKNMIWVWCGATEVPGHHHTARSSSLTSHRYEYELDPRPWRRRTGIDVVVPP